MGRRAALQLIGDGIEQSHSLDVPRFTVGRTKENSLAIPDPAISRHHAEFIRLGNDILLRDLGSTNGSYINGSRIAEQLLGHGDVVRFGPSGAEYQVMIMTDDGLPLELTTRRREMTGDLIDSLSHQLQSSPGDLQEDASLRCVLAEAHLTKGEIDEALRIMARFNDPGCLLSLPMAARATTLLWLGRAYLEDKQYRVAADVLDRGLHLAAKENDEDGVAEARASYGRALIGLKDLLTARDQLNRAMLTARRGGNARLGAEVHLWLGKVDWKDGDFDGACYNWTRAVRLAEGLNAPLLQARVALQQAFVLYAEGKIKESVPAYEAAIERIRALGNIPLLLKAYSNLSRAYVRLGAWAAAQRLLDERLTLSRQIRINKAIAVALTDLAELNLLMGNLPGAVNAIKEALAEHGDKIYARTQRILGRIEFTRGQHREAIEALEVGLANAREYGALEEQILIGLELARAHIEVGELGRAQTRLIDAEATTSLDPALTLMGRALYTRGYINTATNQYPEANRCFMQALTIFQNTGDPYRSGLCQEAIGELRARVGRDDSARAHFEEAHRLFTKLGAAIDIRRIDVRLSSTRISSVEPKMTSATARLSRTARLSLSHLTGGLNTSLETEYKPQQILVGVADEELSALLIKGLEVENYLVTRVLDGRTALDQTTNKERHFDLLLLDALLEYRSGFDLCRELRKQKQQTPVILLGSRQGIEDKIEALQSGADDYLSKRNLVFEELLAKIDALLR
jgi:tetratricopeptide (TPR) repeat protein